MRISDWSSDVFSSDLGPRDPAGRVQPDIRLLDARRSPRPRTDRAGITGARRLHRKRCSGAVRHRKRVVKGKSLSVRVDLGGGRHIKKKHNEQTIATQSTTYQVEHIDEIIGSKQ